MPPLAPPPPYEDDDALLGRMLADLALVDTDSRPTTPPRRTPAYRVQTPTTTGTAASWSEAAAATQGVPGASPRRLQPKSRKHKKNGAYVVFFGLVPGVYRLWYEEAYPLVNGVSGSVYCGYPNVPLATAAYEYARVRGWTRILPSFHLDVRVVPTAIPRLPTPSSSSDLTNPLHTELDGRWYVVYCGISPGVYQSSLECTLNTLGLSCATHDSFPTKELAFSHFREAAADGRVKVVSPKYFTSLSGVTVHAVPHRSLMSFTFIVESPPRLVPLSEVRELKKQEQRTKSRVRMARSVATSPYITFDILSFICRLRMKLKELPPEQQEPYKVRARHARARYREMRRQQKMSSVPTPVV
ncbi:hypothetical protein DFH06DRAFT_1342525 [Mycena polygramma]|nr:hypothetical protein DFH06DRAFT_1342525 [Mycena polygramma]